MAGANAIVIATEWDEFLEFDYAAIFEKMSKPAHVFDFRCMVDKEKLSTIGFTVFKVGEGQPDF